MKSKPKTKRKMTDEGRERIAAAQRKRWRAYRKAKKAEAMAKPARKQRKAA